MTARRTHQTSTNCNLAPKRMGYPACIRQNIPLVIITLMTVI